MTSLHVAIVGAGYSGTVQAIELLRRGLAVTLIERGPRLARGVAYGTDRADHLLNVRSSGMSALAGQPDHFAEWAASAGIEFGDGFAPRHVYGAYLAGLLASAQREAGDRLRIRNDEVVAIEAAARLRFASRAVISADAIVLALGNLPPETLGFIPPDLPSGTYVGDPWAADLVAGLDPQDIVLLVGTGLTAIDAVLTLDSAGFAGQILALSRRGLAPRAHAAQAQAPPPPPANLTPRCTALLRSVRAEADQLGWRGAVDALRPVTQSLWAAASVPERQRFLRHLRPWWDVHRHRIAPRIAARIERMQRDGRLTNVAGKIMHVSAEAHGAAVTWRPRRSSGAERILVRKIVNCTGPRANLLGGGDPLLDSLLATGQVRPDRCRIGLDVDASCRVVAAGGTASDALFAIGPLTRGTFWEIVAVPDLRNQIAAVADRVGDLAQAGAPHRPVMGHRQNK